MSIKNCFSLAFLAFTIYCKYRSDQTAKSHEREQNVRARQARDAILRANSQEPFWYDYDDPDLTSAYRQRASRHFAEQGFRVSESEGPQGTHTIRLRGSWEQLMALANPDSAREKPPLPEDLDVDALPSYHCGCPHCGATSLYGEGQWRYQELSRTRGPWDNTTTFLVKCKKCLGFMKCLVDHDE